MISLISAHSVGYRAITRIQRKSTDKKSRWPRNVKFVMLDF